jgi:MFS family permease
VTAEAAATDTPSPTRRWWLLALLATAFLMTVLDGTSLLTALPVLQRDLRLDSSATQWTVTVYALAFSGPLLLCGRAADLLGRKKMFLAGMALRVVAALLCGLASSAGFLVAARALQGLSAAVIAPSALSMVVNAFPEGPQRNRALGVWGGLGGVGATAGLLLGGLVTGAFGWQWVFWINVPVGIAVLLIGPRLLPESRDREPDRRVDLAGASAVTATLVLLVYTVTRIPTAGWASAPTGGLLLATAACAALFVVIERRSARPLVPLRLLRSRSLVGGNLLILIAGMSVDGMLVTLTGYTQRVLGWPPVRFGLVAAVMTVASVVGALAGQRVVTRFGPRSVAVCGTVLLGGACVLLARVAVVGVAVGGAVVVPVVLVAFGGGMGAAAVGGQITALRGVRERDSGLGAGFADTSFAVGTALGVAVCTSVAAVGAHASTDPADLVAGARLAFEVGGGFAAVGVVVAVVLLDGRGGFGRGGAEAV